MGIKLMPVGSTRLLTRTPLLVCRGLLAPEAFCDPDRR
jgi:hypothetical protein